MAALEDIYAHFKHIPQASKQIIKDYFNLSEWPDELIKGLFQISMDRVNNIKVCQGPCCRQAGSDHLAEELETEFHTSIERHHCLGSCQTPPAAMVNGEIVSNATPALIRKLLEQN